MKKFLLFFLQLFIIYTAFPQQWTKVNVPRSRDVNDVKIFAPGNMLAMGGHYRNDSIEWVIKTYDSGITWDLIQDRVSSWLTSVDFTDSIHGVAVGTNGKIRATSDAGDSWSTVATPIIRDFNDIVFPTAQLGIIVGGAIDTAGSVRQTILKSTDGGQSWNVIRDTSGFWLTSVFFTSPTVGYAVGDSGLLLKTLNGGDSWSPSPLPVQRHLSSIFFADANSGCIVGGLPGDSVRTILVTGDGGDNWNIVKDEPGGYLTDVYFLNTDTGYAVGEAASFYKTTDGGQTWQQEVVTGSHSSDDFNVVRFFSKDYAFIGGKEGRAFVFSHSGVPEAQTLGYIYDSTGATEFFGRVNTNGFPGQYWFVFSEDSSFDNFNYFETFPQSIQTNSPVTVSVAVNGLTPDTVYYYFIRAKTLSGMADGDTLSLFTRYFQSDIQTFVATQVTDTSAQLSGRVVGFGLPVTLTFEYGVTKAFGSQVSPDPAIISDTSVYPVTGQIGNLTPNTIYYYRLKAENALGLTYYSDVKQLFTGIAIPNWDFQHWSEEVVTLPAQWTVANDNFERVPGRSGNYALKLVKDNLALLGKILPDTDSQGGTQRLLYGGIPINTRPDSVIGYFNYNLPTGDTALVLVQLINNGSPVSYEFYPIVGSSGGDFKRIAFKLNYSSPLVPDSLTMGLVSTNPFDTTYKDHSNNVLIIDDISLSGSSVPALPNAGFEDWFQYTSESPDGWYFTKYLYYDNLIRGDLPMVTKAFFEQPYDFAAEVRNLDAGDGYYFGGGMEASSSSRLFNENAPAFPVYHRHATLNGYYRCYPAGDTLRINLIMFYQGDDVAHASLDIADTVTQFKPFTAMIFYNDSVVVPDSALLKVQFNGTSGQARALIDKLSFDGFRVSVIDSTGDTTGIPVDTTQVTPFNRPHLLWQLYPNPAQDKLLVRINTNSSLPYMLTIVDLNGREVYQTEIPPDTPGRAQAIIPVRDLPGGFYIVKLAHPHSLSFKKLIVNGR